MKTEEAKRAYLSNANEIDKTHEELDRLNQKVKLCHQRLNSLEVAHRTHVKCAVDELLAGTPEDGQACIDRRLLAELLIYPPMENGPF